MSLSRKDVLHVANLAHIDLSDAQIEQMEKELNDIFAMIEEIRAVNTDQVEPLLHPHDANQRLRDDVIREGDIRDKALPNAPESTGDMFLVPQYVES